MSIYGDIADRFQQGYSMGRQIRSDVLQRREAKAYQDYLGADEAAGAIPTEQTDIETGVEQIQARPEAGIPLDINRGIRKEYGGSMDVPETPEGGMPAALGARTQQRFAPGAAIPEERIVKKYDLDPQSHAARREAQARLLKAVAARDPGRAMMMEQALNERRRQDILGAIEDAMVAEQMGDTKGMSEAVLHAYGQINDGGAAQIRRAPDGQLYAAAYDMKTGAFRDVVPINGQVLSKLHGLLSEGPMAMRRFEMQEDEHGWRGAQAQREAELFPTQKRAAELGIESGELQVDNMRFMRENRKELMSLDLQTRRAQLKALEDRGLLALAQASYYLSGGRSGRSGGMTPSQELTFLKDARAAADKISFAPDSLEGMYMNSDPTTRVEAMNLGAHIARNNPNAAGERMPLDVAVKMGYRLSALEAMAEGRWNPNENPDSDVEFSLEKEVQDVFPSKENASGKPAVYAVIDGQPIVIDRNMTPAIADIVQANAKHTLDNTKPGTPEHEEAKSILSILGDATGYFAGHLSSGVGGGIPFDDEYQIGQDADAFDAEFMPAFRGAFNQGIHANDEYMTGDDE